VNRDDHNPESSLTSKRYSVSRISPVRGILKRETRCGSFLVWLLTTSYGGEISRTATGDAPLPRIGVAVQPVPQPAKLITVVSI